MMTGGEEAVIAVFESEPALADVCPPDGVTMLHRAAGQGTLLVAKWLLDHGADVNRKSHPTSARDGRRWTSPHGNVPRSRGADRYARRWPRCSSNVVPH